MLKVFVTDHMVGNLFNPESAPQKFHFGYVENCPAERAVSLTMPVVNEHYASDYKTLHPIFDMNLPEGALAERLKKKFSKVIANFDDLAMLKIVGKSQIGRLRFAPAAEPLTEMPAENLNDLLTHDGAEGLFESLLNRYAVHSGISGAMPKVLLRASSCTDELNRVTHKGATHIVKAWTAEFSRLAENEYFCMRAALHTKLEVPKFHLSKEGNFLVVERFDLNHDQYLGFEDFCVLNGKTASQKYDGSYEGVTKRIKEFVSSEQVHPALESFFKALALSCAIRNGDAHLKNFGVLYSNTESTVKLSPIYDLVTTTAYIPSDILALTLGGTKRWPKSKALIAFARNHCNLTELRARKLLSDVNEGVQTAAAEARAYMQNHALFRGVGEKMLAEWDKGLECMKYF